MSELLLKNGRVIDPINHTDSNGDIGIADGIIVEPSQLHNPQCIDVSGKIISPGFIDLHVHLRQPGNTSAETIATGTAAAAAGGFTSIVAMPNTNPAADNAGAIELIKQIAATQGKVKVLPCGSMTKGGNGTEMAGIGALKKTGVIALSDDGHCVQDHALMRHIVEYAKSFGLPILDHCEDYSLAHGGVMHEGKWSVLLGMNGISSASEELMISRNIMLARQINWKIHMQHVSCKESVELLREARKRNVPVTGEATPHHIALTDECIKWFDTNYKMNPPLRAESDRQALIAGLADGTITVIATDHAPHTATAKLVEFDNAPFGIIGLETALGVCFTELVVKTQALTIPQLINKFTVGPAEVLGWHRYGLNVGSPADITVFDPVATWKVDKNLFLSKARNTPFDGMQLTGKTVLTIVDGKIVYQQLHL